MTTLRSISLPRYGNYVPPRALLRKPEPLTFDEIMRNKNLTEQLRPFYFAVTEPPEIFDMSYEADMFSEVESSPCTENNAEISDSSQTKLTQLSSKQSNNHRVSLLELVKQSPIRDPILYFTDSQLDNFFSACKTVSEDSNLKHEDVDKREHKHTESQLDNFSLACKSLSEDSNSKHEHVDKHEHTHKHEHKYTESQLDSFFLACKFLSKDSNSKHQHVDKHEQKHKHERKHTESQLDTFLLACKSLSEDSNSKHEHVHRDEHTHEHTNKHTHKHTHKHEHEHEHEHQHRHRHVCAKHKEKAKKKKKEKEKKEKIEYEIVQIGGNDSLTFKISKVKSHHTS